MAFLVATAIEGFTTAAWSPPRFDIAIVFALI
jgi:hypothetical protein